MNLMLRELTRAQLAAGLEPGDSGQPIVPVSGIEVLAVDHELVLRHPSGAVFVLDRTGALIWRSLDGKAGLDDLAVDLAFVTGAPLEIVRVDVEACIGQLAYAGLVTHGGAAARGWRRGREAEALEAEQASPGHEQLEPAPEAVPVSPDVLAATVEEGERLRAKAIADGTWPADEHGEPVPLRTVTQTFEWSNEDDDEVVIDANGMAYPAAIPTFVPSVPAGSCLGRKLHLDRDGSVMLVPVGDDSVRVRCDVPELGEWLADEFGAVPVEARDAISLHVVTGGADLGRSLVRLLDGAASSLARGSADRVRDALWGWLRWAAVVGPTGLRFAVDTVLVGDGVALLDRRLSCGPGPQTRLSRAGHPLLDQPGCAIDPSSGRAVILDPWPDTSSRRLAVRALIGVRETDVTDASPSDRAVSAGWLLARLAADQDAASATRVVERIVAKTVTALLDLDAPGDLLAVLRDVEGGARTA